MTERVVLERAGRLLSREVILQPLRAALLGAGAASGAEIEIAGFMSPMVAQDAHVDAGVEQVDFDANSGRFAATIVLTGTAVETQRFRLSGQVAEMADLPVPTHPLPPGSVIGPADLRVLHVRATLVHGEVVRATEQAIGKEMRRGGYTGQPIALADLARPADVLKGRHVTMELEAPGLALSMAGIALQSGADGERIAVLNATSRAVVEADVVGRDRVRVAPGTTPTAVPGNFVAQLVPQ